MESSLQKILTLEALRKNRFRGESSMILGSKWNFAGSLLKHFLKKGKFMGNSFAKMKKQARQLQQQLEKMQQEMQDLEVTGSAGNGLVKVILCGDNSLKKIFIKRDCIDPDDPEALEDLIQAAFEDAQSQLQQKSNNSLLNPSTLNDFSANF